MGKIMLFLKVRN